MRKKRRKMKKSQKRKVIITSFLTLALILTFSFIGIKAHAYLSAPKTSPSKVESIATTNEETKTKPNDTTNKDLSVAFQDGKTVEGTDAINTAESSKPPERQPSKEKVAYLTFDDGPTTNITPLVLDTLKKYDVKATFFVLGKMVEQNPDVLKKTYDEGHLIANHSYSHDYKYIYASVDNFLSDFKKSEDIIKNTLNIESKIEVIRFPGGSFPKKLESYRQAAAKKGYKSVDWNCLNEDAQGGKKTAQQLVDSVIKTSKGKNELVILMHDSATKQATADSLGQVIDYLKSEGYRFDTLNNYY